MKEKLDNNSEVEKLKNSLNLYKSKLENIYLRANSYSKKKKIAKDLYDFMDIYKGVFDEEAPIAWENDIEIKKIYYDIDNISLFNLFEKIYQDKYLYSKMAKNVITSFYKINYPYYKVNLLYSKNLSKISKDEFFELIYSFLKNYNIEEYGTLKNIFNDLEILITNSLERDEFTGETKNISALKKIFIILKEENGINLEVLSTAIHEFGHSYEFNLQNNAKDNLGIDMFSSVYTEVSSTFFEYSFLNYLVDNNIHKKEAIMCLDEYYKSLLNNFANIGYSTKFKNISLSVDDNIIEGEVNDIKNLHYIQKIKEKTNFYSIMEFYDIISFIENYLYGIGKLFSIYMYENYQKDKQEFKTHFNNALCNYPIINNISAFEKTGVDEKNIIRPEILKKSLSKQLDNLNRY